MRKIILMALAAALAIVPLFADEATSGADVAATVDQSTVLEGEWWYGRMLEGFEYDGLQNVAPRTLDSLLRPYIGETYTPELESEIDSLLYSQSWLEYISGYEMLATETGGLRVRISLQEISMVTQIRFEGNSEVRSATLEAQQSIQVGDFFSPGLLRANAASVRDYYLSHGYAEAVVDAYSEFDEATNTVTVVYSVTEAPQYKIRAINFTGNSAISAKDLKGEMTSKERSFFRSGNYVQSTLESDLQTLQTYYHDNGYIDAVIEGYELVDVTAEGDNYHMVDVDITVSEGSQWLMGSITWEGNSVFSDDEIAAEVYLKSGVVLNQTDVLTQIQAIASLYYNDGYIQTQIVPQTVRDDQAHTVSYHLVITESGQSVIERIVITGLTKTKPYVLERELEMKVGDVFSQADLQASGQNILNTGIVTDIQTGLYQGESENGVVLEIAVEEGNQMQLQFGATFGGNVGSFPVSGFLAWSDTNLFGTGRDFSISTNLSPDNQSFSISLSDGWVGNQRWSNGLSFSFERSYEDYVLQRGTGSDYYNWSNEDDNTYPLGFTSNAEWAAAGKLTSASTDLMTYNFLSFSLGYSTGYTFNFRPGDLTISGGVSLGLSHAAYDDSYDPYERQIMRYHDGWQFSNNISLSLTWDGRDLVTDTTRGYMFSLGYTYAGGFLFGLSNYNRLSFSAAGYVPLFTYVNDQNQSSSLVLSGTTSLAVMLPQFWNNNFDDNTGWGWYSPFEGATRYEMLYIDGMTMGRGFSPVLGLSFLWHNQVELSYPVVRNVLNVEGYISADGAIGDLDKLTSFSALDWYFSGGFGIKLRIPGFPLGLYWAKTATLTQDGGFQWQNGTILGGNIVLAITMSLY